MRKFLLFFILAPLGLFAQSANTDIAPHHAANNIIGITDKTPMKIPVSRLAAKNQIQGMASFSVLPTDTFTMGITVYDLQTNASVARRIIAYPDGEISAVWTTAPEINDALFTIRGTGYNHYFANSSSWLLPAGNLTQIIEKTNYHTGWPNPLIDSQNSPVHEFSISHSPGGVVGIVSSTLQRIDNQAIGNNTWSQQSPLVTNSPIWPRVAQSGKYAYMIANYDSIANQAAVEIKGIKTPTVLFRSTDGGTTWTNDSTLPGSDTSGNIAASLYGGSDAYAIDAQGSTVAIVLGGYFQDVSLWKSNDYGVTWTKTLIDTFQLRYNHNHSKGQPDYFTYPNVDTMAHYTNDGSVNVILDQNNVAHVFYGVRGIKDSGGIHNDSFYVRYEGYNGIMHWDEKNQHKAIIGYSPDLNSNGVLDVGDGFFDATTTANVVYYEYGNDGLTSMPTATIDANGNIYCVYSVYMEAIDPTLATSTAEVDVNSPGGTSVNDYLHYRDLYITYSKDGGNSWQPEQNITKTPTEEEVFPSLARYTDTQLHLEYMSDSLASDFVAGYNTQITTRQVLPDYNRIKYMGININDVTSGNFGSPENYEGISPIQSNALFSVSDIYPNPSAQGSVNVAITMNHADNGSIEIYDIAGNLMSTQVLGTLNYGKQIKNINTEGLSAGMYFVKINAGGYTTVNKLVIQ